MKIVIASDSFKGSLSSVEVAEAAAEGIHRVCPEATVVKMEVADGGEGTAESLVRALKGAFRQVKVTGPLGDTVIARYGIAETPSGPMALIDCASASGLTLVPPGKRDVMSASSHGTGELILAAIEKGCRRFVIGLGGSATCDGGTGMLEALGYRFLDREGKPVKAIGANLLQIESIDSSRLLIDTTICEFTILSDVTNPLFGPDGASFVFAPQKGADARQTELLDAGLRNLACVAGKHTGKRTETSPGAGAAGGLGYAFMTFLNADVKSGVDAVLDIVGFDEAVSGADLVITGEGKIDRQTLFGKLPGGVCRRAAKAGVPTVAIAGAVEDTPLLLQNGFAGIFPIHRRPLSAEEAMNPAVTREAVADTAASIAMLLHAFTTNPSPATMSLKYSHEIT